MYRKKAYAFFLILLIIILSACKAQTVSLSTEESAESVESPTAEVMADQTADEASEDAAPEEEVDNPDTFHVVTLHSATIDANWDKAFVQAMERVIDLKPHGLTIVHEIVESVPWADAERIMKDYAATGEYDLIFIPGLFRDEACATAAAYPDQLITITTNREGYDCYEAGKNLYVFDSSNLGYCGYLVGALAGLTTESNLIAATAPFPSTDINEPLNAFIEGAESVNPDVKVTITFIESWYDPPLARDAAEAQLNIGADFVWALVDGAFEVVEENGAKAAGLYIDQNYLAEDTIVTSAVALWDRYFLDSIDVWWENQINGTPYSGPEVAIGYTISDGVCDLVIDEDLVSQEVIDQIANIKSQLVDGTLQIEITDELPE